MLSHKSFLIVTTLAVYLLSPTWSAETCSQAQSCSPVDESEEEIALLQTYLVVDEAQRADKAVQTQMASKTHMGKQHAESTSMVVPVHQDCSKLSEQQATDEPRAFTNFDHGSNYEGLYVNPDAELGFCLIEKNACSSWIRVFNKLEEANLDVNNLNFGLRQQTYNDERAMEVFQNPNATRGVFVRDPLERFLSGFLDKCFGDGCRNPYCFMRESSQEGTQISFKQAVSWLLHQDLTTLDGHFKPQALHCELEKRIDEYNLIGHMESDSMADTASCFLERAGLSEINTISSQPDSDPFWQPPAADAKKTSDYLKLFYTVESAKAVYDAFSVDYRTFNLSRPDWIESATGQFYASTSGTSCNPGIAVLQRQEAVTDIWDIATLAKRAGFVV